MALGASLWLYMLSPALSKRICMALRASLWLYILSPEAGMLDFARKTMVFVRKTMVFNAPRGVQTDGDATVSTRV